MRRAAGTIAAAAACLFPLSLAVAQSDDAVSGLFEDESVIATVRLPARAGDFELARKRLEVVEKPRLQAMSTAALGHEYALAGHADDAARLQDRAVEIAAGADMRVLERTQVFMFIARLASERPDGGELAAQMIDRAHEYADRLAGIDQQIALAELASTILQVSGDRRQAFEVLNLSNDEVIRRKLVESFGLADLAGEDN